MTKILEVGTRSFDKELAHPKPYSKPQNIVDGTSVHLRASVSSSSMATDVSLMSEYFCKHIYFYNLLYCTLCCYFNSLLLLYSTLLYIAGLYYSTTIYCSTSIYSTTISLSTGILALLGKLPDCRRAFNYFTSTTVYND